MENNTWVWKRNSTQKNIKKKKGLELERSLDELNERLSSVLTELNAKDDLLAKQEKIAEEAIAGWEKAEAETCSLKQQLADALLQKRAAEERAVDTEKTLKECMQQLHAIKEDQKLIINNAALKISREQESTRTLEQSLVETNKRITELVVQNGNLDKNLQVKEHLLKELIEAKSKCEANFMEVKAKLDSTTKLNASLNYELCRIQKELQIRKEERDINYKSADSAHRQHLESIKRIAKLETECQRLRVMLRQRLPGPAALAKMRSEVEMIGNNVIEKRKKKSNSKNEPSHLKDNGLDSSASLFEKLRVVEDKNMILEQSLAKKDNELQASRIMFARTASKLSQVETQLDKLSNGQSCFELARRDPVSHDHPLSSISDNGSNENTNSCAESWASTSVSELEHFKSGKSTTALSKGSGISELCLMDDFIEMEKLAVIPVEKHLEASLSEFDSSSAFVTTKDSWTRLDLSEVASKVLVPTMDVPQCREANDHSQVKYITFNNYPSWLRDILKVIVQKHYTIEKSIDAILEDVRMVLSDWDSIVTKHSITGSEKVLQKCKHTSPDSFDRAISMGTLNSGNSTHLCQSKLKKPVCKLVELVKGVIQRNITSKNGHNNLSCDKDATYLCHKSSSIYCHVASEFMWGSSELTAVLQNFVAVCDDLLHEKVDPQKFTAEVIATLDWIVRNCFSLQDVSDMKETKLKNLDEVSYEEPITPEEQKTAAVSPLSGLSILSRMEGTDSKLKGENEYLKFEVMSMEARKNSLEEMMKTSSSKNDTLITQLKESEEINFHSEIELATFKESNGQIVDQIINQKLTYKDLGTQLIAAKFQPNKAGQQSSVLEVELERGNDCSSEPKGTCLDLHQTESSSAKETPKYIMHQEEKQIHTERATVGASEELAACQETILQLRKQLKMLTSSGVTLSTDKLKSSPASLKSQGRTQLIDYFGLDDHTMPEEHKSLKIREIIRTDVPNQPPATSKNHKTRLGHGQKELGNIINQLSASKSSGLNDSAGMLMVLPKRQQGVSPLRKFFLRRKRGGNKKLSPPMKP